MSSTEGMRQLLVCRRLPSGPLSSVNPRLIKTNCASSRFSGRTLILHLGARPNLLFGIRFDGQKQQPLTGISDRPRGTCNLHSSTSNKQRDGRSSIASLLVVVDTERSSSHRPADRTVAADDVRRPARWVADRSPGAPPSRVGASASQVSTLEQMQLEGRRRT